MIEITTENITEILGAIDPSALSYEEWVNVGMALKEGGFDCSVWDEWSKKDSRYHTGECERKWESFRGAFGSPITMATVMQMAIESGYCVPVESYALDWNSEIGAKKDPAVIVDRHYLESKEIHPPEKFDPVKELTTYLETLFDSTEVVGYVTSTWEKDGKFLPTKGIYTKTAGEIIQELSRCKGDIGAVIGDCNEQAGAWIRFNPLDGKGVNNENVTEFRYALVESDTMDIDSQNALLRELELPIACLVYSGGKSLHAIVKIDAADYTEYRKRVNYLYDVCQKNGLKIDSQNRNPSRLSRMPGVERNGKKQYIVDINIGKSSFNEWKEWIESQSDSLPDPENLSEHWESMPPLAEPLIENVLRMGHKMLVAGPSKAGKSYALIELCIAIAEGKRWLGFSCRQGRVMYVNLELDSASCLHRFKDVYEALRIEPKNLDNIDIWNLRGKTVPMDKLAPMLIRRAKKKEYSAVVIDPIYKVITGDENSADQMAHFCNQFDKVCTELNCAVIYCHHHSKGVQGGKKSMDRASGSGVFARDPDALIDLIELEIPESMRKQEENEAVCQTCIKWLSRWRKDKWEDDVSLDDMCSPTFMLDYCRMHLTGVVYQNLCSDIKQAKAKVYRKTAWRIEGTLREFPKFESLNVWFDYPVHRADETGKLSDITTYEDKAPWERAVSAHKEKAKKASDDKRTRFENAYNTCSFEDAPTVKELSEALAIRGKDGKTTPMNERTLRDWIKKYGYKIEPESGKVYPCE